jgi:hypothetical protein
MGTELLFNLMKTDYHISSTTVSLRNKLGKKYKGQQCHYLQLLETHPPPPTHTHTHTHSTSLANTHKVPELVDY